MIQTCNAAYWEHMESVLARNGDPENPGQPCGKIFNDVDHSTICPHDPLPVPLSQEERDRILSRVVPSVPTTRIKPRTSE